VGVGYVRRQSQLCTQECASENAHQAGRLALSWDAASYLAQKALDNFSSSPAPLPEQGSDRSSGILAQCKLGETACLMDGEGPEGLFYFRDGGRGHA
jgi:hypothetical protein